MLYGILVLGVASEKFSAIGTHARDSTQVDAVPLLSIQHSIIAHKR